VREDLEQRLGTVRRAYDERPDLERFAAPAPKNRLRSTGAAREMTADDDCVVCIYGRGS
jgi:hypothetical protein